MQENFSKYNGDGTMLRKAQLRLLDMLVEIDKICKKHNIIYWIDGGTPLGAVRHGGFIPWDDDIDIALTRKDYLKLIKILETELPDNYILQNRKNEKFYHLLFSRVVDKNSLSHYDFHRLPNRHKMKYQGIFLDIVYIEKGDLTLKQIIDFFYIRAFSYPRLTSNILKKLYGYIAWPIISLIIYIIRGIYYFIPTDRYIFGYGIPFKRKLRKSEILPVKDIRFESILFPGPNNVTAYLKRYYGDYMTIPPPEQRAVHADRINIF